MGTEPLDSRGRDELPNEKWYLILEIPLVFKQESVFGGGGAPPPPHVDTSGFEGNKIMWKLSLLLLFIRDKIIDNYKYEGSGSLFCTG